MKRNTNALGNLVELGLSLMKRLLPMLDELDDCRPQFRAHFLNVVISGAEHFLDPAEPGTDFLRARVAKLSNDEIVLEFDARSAHAVGRRQKRQRLVNPLCGFEPEPKYGDRDITLDRFTETAPLPLAVT